MPRNDAESPKNGQSGAGTPSEPSDTEKAAERAPVAIMEEPEFWQLVGRHNAHCNLGQVSGPQVGPLIKSLLSDRQALIVEVGRLRGFDVSAGPPVHLVSGICSPASAGALVHERVVG